MLTMGEAAKRAGVSKATIFRAIKAGKVSATRNERTNGWDIDPVELFRVFPATGEIGVTGDGNSSVKQNATPANATPETPKQRLRWPAWKPRWEGLKRRWN